MDEDSEDFVRSIAESLFPLNVTKKDYALVYQNKCGGYSLKCIYIVLSTLYTYTDIFSIPYNLVTRVFHVSNLQTTQTCI